MYFAIIKGSVFENLDFFVFTYILTLIWCLLFYIGIVFVTGQKHWVLNA
jgi:hypothetical protein